MRCSKGSGGGGEGGGGRRSGRAGVVLVCQRRRRERAAQAAGRAPSCRRQSHRAGAIPGAVTLAGAPIGPRVASPCHLTSARLPPTLGIGPIIQATAAAAVVTLCLASRLDA
jgi:hypothetical protein